jgi:DNA polymerase-3 subunit epsilon
VNAFADVWKASWDTETTGTDVHEDRIVTAAFIVRIPGRKDRPFSWLINPGVPIPAEVSEIHGITDARAQAEGVEPKTALDEIAGHLTTALTLRMPLIAFNQAFDWSILHYELIRHGLPTVGERLGAEPVTLVDPIVLDKQFDRYVKGAGQRKLKPTCGRYGVELKDWHTAEADALAALLIAEAQFERFPRLNGYSPPELFAAQQAWRAEHQAGLQAHLRKTEEGAYCAPEWPLIPAAGEGVQA